MWAVHIAAKDYCRVWLGWGNELLIWNQTWWSIYGCLCLWSRCVFVYVCVHTSILKPLQYKLINFVFLLNAQCAETSYVCMSIYEFVYLALLEYWLLCEVLRMLGFGSPEGPRLWWFDLWWFHLQWFRLGFFDFMVVQKQCMFNRNRAFEVWIWIFPQAGDLWCDTVWWCWAVVASCGLPRGHEGNWPTDFHSVLLTPFWFSLSASI